MAKGFKHGSGGIDLLNLKVVGNPQPQTAKENTIWVDTDIPITGWLFSSQMPENPEQGMVWFLTATHSGAQFNALKKNGIMVYPLAAKQYVSGAWANVTAKSYQNGALVDWWNGELYENGNQYIPYTGGWTTSEYIYWTNPCLAEFNESNIRIYFQSGKGCGGVGTENKVDLSGYNTVKAIVYPESVLQFGILDNKSDDMYVGKGLAKTSIPARTDNVNQTISLDISSIDAGYISFGTDGRAYIYEVWME